MPRTLFGINDWGKKRNEVHLMTFSPQYSGENAHRLSKNTKTPLKGFKSGARSLGVSSGKITLFKAAIIVHNISSKRKEERAEISP